MKLSKEELAKKGEQLAADFLVDKGFEILERNYRFSHGEIDIIALDPKDNYTVFVEVKTRQDLYFGEPEYAVNRKKQQQVKKVAELYLYDKEIENIDCRFDVVAILLEDVDNPVINYYENAFM